jgi:hypothetical protein
MLALRLSSQELKLCQKKRERGHDAMHMNGSESDDDPPRQKLSTTNQVVKASVSGFETWRRGIFFATMSGGRRSQRQLLSSIKILTFYQVSWGKYYQESYCSAEQRFLFRIN